MRIVGMPKMFSEKVITVTLDNYRAILPDNYYSLIQIRKANSNIVLHSSMDAYHIGENKHSITPSYKIQGNIIYTSIKEGQLEVSYRALELDEYGYPMIPDNSSLIKALELYIKKQYFTILFDLGKITAQVLNNTQQEYSWYVGQCQSDLIRPTWDEMKSITNTWTNIIINNKYRDNKTYTSKID
jgi:hypothetical protein